MSTRPLSEGKSIFTTTTCECYTKHKTQNTKHKTQNTTQVLPGTVWTLCVFLLLKHYQQSSLGHSVPSCSYGFGICLIWTTSSHRDTPESLIWTTSSHRDTPESLKKTFSKLFANLFLKRFVNVYKKSSSSRRQKRKQTACDFFYFFPPPNIKPTPTSPQEVGKVKET